MTIEIRRCVAADVPEVMRFVDEHWARGHVLATSRALFDWQYRSRHRDGYNVFLAVADDGCVVGMLGYISTASFGAPLDRATVWLALWKVRDRVGPPGLGLRLLRALTADELHEAIGVLGIGDPRQAAMYRGMRFDAGSCAQLVVFDPTRDLSLAVVPPGTLRPQPAPGASVLRSVEAGDLERIIEEVDVDPARVPAKGAAYLRARFVDHPFYDYRLHVVARADRPVGVLVSRIAEHEDARAVRLVDFVGAPEELAECGTAVGSLIAEAGAEHADLWCAGFDPAIVERAGFARVDPDGPITVPSYFEPFVRRNTTLLYALRAPGRPYAIFRADGDQDRPNLLPAPAP